jgi:hypothetical protein
MSEQTVQAVLQVLKKDPNTEVCVLEHSALIYTQDQQGREYTLKIRPVSKNGPPSDRPMQREHHWLRTAANRLPRTHSPCFTHLFPVNCLSKVHVTALHFSLGGETFSGLSLESVFPNGFLMRGWCQIYRESNDGDQPDSVRYLMQQMIGGVNDIHSMGLAINGFDLHDLALFSIRVGGVPELGFKIVESCCGVVGSGGGRNSGLNYNSTEMQMPPSRSDTSFSKTDITKATIIQISGQAIDKDLAEKHLNFFTPRINNQKVGSTPLETAKRNDKQAIALVACSLFSEKDIDQATTRKLLQCQNITELARTLEYLIKPDQQDNMSRVFSVMLGFMTNTMSLDAGMRHKGMQFPIVSSAVGNDLAARDGGLLVPSRTVAKLKDKNTGQPSVTSELLIKNQKSKGMGTHANNFIKKGGCVTLYAGTTTNSRGRFSKYALGLGKGYRLDAQPNDFWTTERVVRRACVGHLLNSSRVIATVSKKGNVDLDTSQQFIDEDGLLKIPMFALCDIEPGTELVWDYDFKAGARGALMTKTSDSEDGFEDSDNNGKQ